MLIRDDWFGDAAFGLDAGKADGSYAEAAGSPTGEQGGVDSPGDTSTTDVLTIGGFVDGNIGTPDDVDWVRVTLVAGQSYRFTLAGAGASPIDDPFLRLHAANGTLITYDDDSGPGRSSVLRYTPTVSGTYYLGAAGFDSSEVGTYRLTGAEVPPQNPLNTIDWGGIRIAGNELRLYFAAAGEPYMDSTASRSWGANEKQAAILAAATYAGVLNLTVTLVSDPASANVLMVLDSTIEDVGFATPNAYPAYVAFNPSGAWWTASGALLPGGESYQAIIHELGHVLGLAHPHDDGGGSEVMEGVDEPFDSFGIAKLNQGVFTVMSYNDGWPLGPAGEPTSYGSGAEATPMALDIALLQQKYGASVAHNGGDTTYDLSSLSVGSRTWYEAIWDTGGIDSISDTSGRNVVIDLRPATLLNQEGGGGYVSYINNTTTRGGFTIAAGVVIENATSGSGEDHLIGNTGVNRLASGAGVDWLEGREGDDVLDGGSGSDTLNGGTGADWMYGGLGGDIYYVDTQADLIFEDYDESGADEVRATSSFYLYANVENLRMDTGAVFAVGNDRPNTIWGNSADNLIIGGAGFDQLTGGSGADSLFGQADVDFLWGDSGVDYLVGGDGDDMLSGGSDPDALYGEDGKDNLDAGSGFFTDILVGGAGDDILQANTLLGDYDLLDGGSGDDIYYVDTPADLTFEAAGGGTDLVIANINGAGYYLYPNVENLRLEERTPFGVGNELDNVLTGSEFANWLLGGAGNDTLSGGGGNDVLFGEAGADTFVMISSFGIFAPGADYIGDFAPGQDKVRLIGFYGSFSQMQSHMVENAGSTAIDLGNGNLVVLGGVALSSLSAGDFLFA